MNAQIAEHLRRRGGFAWWPSVFFAFLFGILVAYGVTRIPHLTVLTCPDNCLGVEKIEGPNAFATRNLKTGQAYEWRLRANPPVDLHAGYVIEISFVERGKYEDIDGIAMPYHIVRGKELDRVPAYSIIKPFVNFDGDDRPVLAKNCRNTPDDADVICVGGEAQFVQELSQR